jgi:hypothetical protein
MLTDNAQAIPEAFSKNVVYKVSSGGEIEA